MLHQTKMGSKDIQVLFQLQKQSTQQELNPQCLVSHHKLTDMQMNRNCHFLTANDSTVIQITEAASKDIKTVTLMHPESSTRN